MGTFQAFRLHIIIIGLNEINTNELNLKLSHKVYARQTSNEFIKLISFRFVSFH